MVPGVAFADTGEVEEIASEENANLVFEHPEFSPNDYDVFLREQAENEVAELIAKAEGDGSSGISLYARPKYDTVYESTRYVSSGWCVLPGQPAGGTRFANGGYIYVNKTGGGNITISVKTGWGSVGVSVPFGKTVSVGGYSVWAPARRYVKAQQSSVYACRPYAIWYTDAYGKRTVYRRAVSSTMYSHQFRCV